MSVTATDSSSAYNSLLYARQLRQQQALQAGSSDTSTTATDTSDDSASGVTAAAANTLTSSSTSSSLASSFLSVLLGLQSNAGNTANADLSTTDAAGVELPPPPPPPPPRNADNSSSSTDPTTTATNTKDTSVDDLMSELEGLLNNTSSPLASSAQYNSLINSTYGSVGAQTGSSYQQTI